MKTIYQLNTETRQPVLVSSIEIEGDWLPFFCVEVAPPDLIPGMVLVWETSLDPVNDVNYGRKGTGYWRQVRHV